MKQTNLDLLRKFETMKRWMIEDTKRAMFQAQANFLVAQGLVAYTEIIGSLITGKGKESGGKNFDTFFALLGPEYRKLLNRHNRRRQSGSLHVVYDDLRCGLLHEYAIKRKGFVIFNSNHEMTDQEIKNDLVVQGAGGEKMIVSSGVVYVKDKAGKGYWLIIDPIYWFDFKNAVDKYWIELCDEKKVTLRRNFFKRAREINFKNFNI